MRAQNPLHRPAPDRVQGLHQALLQAVQHKDRQAWRLARQALLQAAYREATPHPAERHALRQLCWLAAAWRLPQRF